MFAWTEEPRNAYEHAVNVLRSKDQRVTTNSILEAMGKDVVKKFGFKKDIISSYLQRRGDRKKKLEPRRERYAQNAAPAAAAPAAAPPAAAAPAAAPPAAAAAEVTPPSALPPKKRPTARASHALVATPSAGDVDRDDATLEVSAVGPDDEEYASILVTFEVRTLAAKNAELEDEVAELNRTVRRLEGRLTISNQELQHEMAKNTILKRKWEDFKALALQ